MSQTHKAKLQKATEVNSYQHKVMVVAICRAMPLGRRTFPVRYFLQKGISPLKCCSSAGFEAQVEISLFGSRLTFLGPLQAPYMPLLGEEATKNDTLRVVIDWQCGDFRNVILGVPQGIVLGPLLFILYIQ